MQFKAQREWYKLQFPAAEYQIILHDSVSTGRLIVERSHEVIVLIDIALLPEHRNEGIGTSLIRDLQVEAMKTSRPLRLHVESFNPAFSLYERLGFRQVKDRGVYLLLGWSADGQVNTAS